MEKQKVLIVDDEMFVRKIVAKVLEKEGYTVFVAVDGKDGLTKVESYHPDLVISDLSMPNMNGLEFSLMMKKKNIPVIILSAHVTGATISKLELINVREILIKPFEIEKLVTAVKNALGNTTT